MTTATDQKIQISNGPCKMDLMLSLFEGKEVTFRTPGGGETIVNMQGLSLEDGSRNRWLFHAYIVGDERPWTKISGYYDVVRRKGFCEQQRA